MTTSVSRAAKWGGACDAAKAEFEARGVKNPNDRTAGYLERINAIYNGILAGERVEKAQGGKNRVYKRDAKGKFAKNGYTEKMAKIKEQMAKKAADRLFKGEK